MNLLFFNTHYTRYNYNCTSCSQCMTQHRFCRIDRNSIGMRTQCRFDGLSLAEIVLGCRSPMSTYKVYLFGRDLSTLQCTYHSSCKISSFHGRISHMGCMLRDRPTRDLCINRCMSFERML